MEPTFKKLHEKSNYIFLTCFVLLVLAWITDYLIDATFSGEGIARSLLVPDPRVIAFHLILFAIQVAFLVAIFTIFKMLRKMEVLLEGSIRAASEERAKSEAIVAALGDGISIQDREYRILYQNKAHMEMVGGSCVGKYCFQAYDGGDSVCR